MTALHTRHLADHVNRAMNCRLLRKYSIPPFRSFYLRSEYQYEANEKRINLTAEAERWGGGLAADLPRC